VALVAIAFAISGWIGALFFTLAAVFAKALLEVVNYMEHYGMVRVPDQPVQPRHSWNTNTIMSSWAMFNLGRHSHHHAQGEIPFQDLMPLDEAPQMRFGYLSTMFATLVPPLWHNMMAAKLKEWDKDFASPEERVLALRANQQSGVSALQDYNPRLLPAAPAAKGA